MKITDEIIAILFEYAQRLYRKEISYTEAIEHLKSKGINKNSASDYLYNYENLIDGKLFTRTTSVAATKYYLEQIRVRLDAKYFSNALQALALHIDYYEEVTGHPVIEKRILLNEQLSLLQVRSFENDPSSLENLEIDLVEGQPKKIEISIYERNPIARARCIAHYGTACQVCGLDFGKKYGQIGKGFIHVHHLLELSQIKKEYQVDPVRDLVPVCPNCHAMLHKKAPAIKLEELRKLIMENA